MKTPALLAFALVAAPAAARADPGDVPTPMTPTAPSPPAPFVQFEPAPMTPSGQSERGVRGVPRFMLAPHEPATRWYGWQTLILLGASDASIIAGTLVAESARSGAPESVGAALGIVGITGHIFAGPMVHWSRGQVGLGFAALGVTLGAAILGGAIGAGIGAAADNSCHYSCAGPLIGFVFGGAIGGFIGPFLDVGLLSDERPPDDRFAWSIRPLRLGARGFGAGVVGAF